MKRMVSESKGFLWSIVFLAVAALSIVGCGGGGGGGGGGTSGATTTTISGKVTLSSTVSGKPAYMFSNAAKTASKARMAKARGKAGASDIAGSQMQKVLSAAGVRQTVSMAALGGATVELYDADHPEWLYPIAYTTASSDGSFTIDTLINACTATVTTECNDDAAYTNGAEIPVGKYTLIAYKYDISYGKLFVAVQSIVNEYSGVVTGNDLTAQDSEATPSIVSMFGLSKNTDGSYGSNTTPLPANAAIQVTFSMAMARLTVLNAVSITDSSSNTVTGSWKISSDLLSATFVPAADLTADTVYTVKVAGGKSSNAAKNVYGKAITSEVKGYFKTVTADPTPPTAIRISPTSAEKSNMELTTPIRIASDEVLDINTIAVASSPSIGAKPGILYIGKTGSGDYPFVYEIVPADPFTLGTTYTITVSGGTDLAGNAMDPLNFSLTTTSASTGVTGTGVTADAQAAVKDVLGKWIRAMNDRNTSVLTTYMTGDFYWLSDDMKGEDDLNRDGRTDLNEFTAMLDNWLVQLEGCGATVSGEIVDDPADATDGIVITGSTANIKFTLTATATNTSDSSCKEVGGPDSALYAELQNINGAWYMTRGSDTQVTTWPASLSVITLSSPGNGNQLAEPTTAMPTVPEFKWTGISGVTTYALVLIDAKSSWGETGWVALVDGTGTSGNEVSVKFNPTVGYTGSVYVMPDGESFGFYNNIGSIKAGGSYYWAVIGFGTKTVTDFVKGVADPAADIVASSDAYNFSVKGTYQELKITVKDSTGKTYDFSEFMNGYNVGSSNSVTLTIERPFNSTATDAYVEVGGYTHKNYSASFGTSGIASVDVSLSNKYNWVRVSDVMDPWDNPSALIKEFNIFTTGGSLPKITSSSVSGKTCTSSAATLTGPTDWNEYISTDACTVSFTVSISSTLTGVSKLHVDVWNDDDNGRYHSEISATPGQSLTLSDIPVYNGFNWVSVNACDGTSDPSGCTGTRHEYGFGVDTLAGSTYTAPITASVYDSTGTTLQTPTSSDYWGSYWDANGASSVKITGIMQNKSANGHYDHNVGEDWTWVTGGDVTINPSTGAYSIDISLYKGWNVINISDSTWSNWYSVHIYTTGGTAYTQPNTITAISKDGGSTWDTSPAYSYNAGSACSVVINGETTTAGMVYVYLNYYNSTTGNSVWEYQSVETDPSDLTSPYSYQITQNVYGGGSNRIDINDANWRWAGVEVTTTCSTVPVAFGVTDVKALSTSLSLDQYGFYNAGSAQTVTVSGTAKVGKSITAYVSGLYYDIATLDRSTDTSTTFAIDIPIYNGDNYISLTDGENWYYLNVYTTGTRAYTPPIYSVSVSSSTLTYGGGTSDNWGQWSTSADSVTITGSAKTNGTGYYYQSGSYTYTSGNFTISGGTFSLPITLDYGWNYISLYDSNWNYYSVTIYTSGGTGKPEQFVTITSPTNSYVVKGTDTANASETVSVNVTGTIISGTTNFVPAYIYGYVYDYNTYQWTSFSSNADDVTYYGYQPLTYNSSTGAFSFTASVKEGNPTYIEVYAYDSGFYTSHGHQIYVNNTWNYSEWFWKPGKKAGAKDAVKNAHKTEFLKKMMSNKPKARNKGR